MTTKTNTEDRLILLMAPSFQGGHCATGNAVAEYLGIPFPLKMDALAKAAKARGFKPNILWPWWAKMVADRNAMAKLEKEDADV